MRARLSDVHPADQAELLRYLEPHERGDVVGQMGAELNPEILVYIDPEIRPAIAASLGPAAIARLLANLEADDAIDFLEYLGDQEQLDILAALPIEERETVKKNLAYDEYTAGRLTQRAFVALPHYWHVGQAIDYLRTHPNLPDDFYDIYLVNARFEPVGSVPLSMVLRSQRTTALRDLKTRDLRSMRATDDQEVVARRFRKYALVSAPVIGESGRMIGVITVDDIVEVIEEEAEEDILKLAGVAESDVFSPAVTTARRRVPWLLVNMITAFAAASVIAEFEASIQELVALAVLMPMVASMGGNGGAQSMTVAVRGIATGEVTFANALRFLGKEAFVGFCNGSVFLAVGAAVALVWFGMLGLALVFGIALSLTLCFAAVIGVTVPLVLERFKVDPAVASAVFVTTVTDVFGFAMFLGLATYFLL